jgi:hypothetical protein
MHKIFLIKGRLGIIHGEDFPYNPICKRIPPIELIMIGFENIVYLFLLDIIPKDLIDYNME